MSSKNVQRVLGLLVAAVSLPACVALEVEVPSVCVRQRGIEMRGNAVDSSVSESFEFPGIALLGELLGDDAEAMAQLHGIRIIAPENIEDMDFVSEAYARIETSSAGLAPIELGCSEGACQAIGRELELAPATVTDMIAYLESDGIKVDVGLAGRLPVETLTVDVDVCLAASLSVTR